MKVSLNWIKQFTDITISTDELVHKVGEQLGAVEEIIDIGAKYKGIYIVKVVSCDKHPNADKLSVCLVDDGGAHKDVERTDKGYIEIVCGAPNVQADMFAVWLPPGATVPASYDKEPFVLEARELRGIVSNGMLASASELAIGDDHNGIVKVDVAANPGDDFAQTYELDDIVLDIENKMFTHRPDCFGILGVAREIAGITGNAFTSPEWYTRTIQSTDSEKGKTQLRINNQIPDVVPRFMAVVLDDVQVRPSPFVMQSYLARVGIRPINNIVDATNYLMILTGQPLHAYDADKLQAIRPESDIQLETRYSRKGDSLTLLDGKTVTFDDEETILITSHDKPVGIGGVMGGADTEVDEATSRIVLECANFDMYAIRRASMRHGLFTDAVTRFNKGQSPNQNDKVLAEAIATVEYVSGASISSPIIDEATELPHSEPISITSDFVQQRLGVTVNADKIKNLLENVEFLVHKEPDNIRVEVPFWRTDISIPEDIVEEVGRLIGFDSLPFALPGRSIHPTPRNGMLDLKYHLRDVLAAAGANEVLTYSFVHGKLLEAVGQDPKNAYRITNALSPDLQYYRQSLTPSLLDKVHINIKAGHGIFTLFEIGKVHQKGLMDTNEPSVPLEQERLSIVFAADDKTWLNQYAGSALYQAKLYLDAILSSLGLTYEVVPINQDELKTPDTSWAPFDLNRSGCIIVDGVEIGIIGELRTRVRSKLKLPIATVAAEINNDALQQLTRTIRYQPLTKYPSISQDISLKLSAHYTHSEIVACVQEALPKQSHTRYDVKLIDIYQSEKDVSSKHVTYRITAVSDQKTMTDTELRAVLAEVADQADKVFGAVQL